MKKLIFRKFHLDTLAFFLTTLIIMGSIVWTIQAVNYFDFVTKDGHGLKVYFTYIILTFPKIIHRILPFIFFVSLFYTIINYELKNELNIFWINGISKIQFTNKLIIFSIFLMVFQILIGSYLSPVSQLKARNYLKNSNIDFFTSLIKEGKFINVAKGLTIFIDKKNVDGTYSNIFLDKSTKNNSKMIYSKKGFLIDNKKNKLFKLSDGRVLNNDGFKINVFDFDQIDFNLNNLTSNTIVVPKIQEIDTLTLLSCFFDIKPSKYQSFKCGDNLTKEIKKELLKRIYKPIYIPLITLICCLLIISSKNKLNYKKIRNLVFIIAFSTLVISEASLRYSVKSNFLTTSYILLPFIIFIFTYFIFYKKVKNV